LNEAEALLRKKKELRNEEKAKLHVKKTLLE
jgi:hypothetical protein